MNVNPEGLNSLKTDRKQQAAFILRFEVNEEIMKKCKIGFIGIGLMGFPMAKNLLKSKYEVKVFNRTKNKALKLKKFGAEVCNSLKEVVSDRDLIITMLSDDKAIKKIYFNSLSITFFQELLHLEYPYLILLQKI